MKTVNLFLVSMIMLAVCKSALAAEWDEYNVIVKLDYLGVVGQLSHQQSYFHLKFNDEPHRTNLAALGSTVCNCDSANCYAGLPIASEIYDSTYSLLLSAMHSNKAVHLTLYTDASKTVTPFTNACMIKEAQLWAE